jgi:hypothetical protein
VGTQNFDSWNGGNFITDFGTGNGILGTYTGGFTTVSETNTFGMSLAGALLLVCAARFRAALHHAAVRRGAGDLA